MQTGNSSVKCIDQYHTEQASLFLGDSAEILRGLPDASMDLCVYSPPFVNLFVYSASERDVGNVADGAEFMAHYSFIAAEVRRLLKPGRRLVVHAMDLPTLQYVHGYQALQPFTDNLVRFHMEQGWHYVGRVVCDTNPQAQAIRNHTRQLLFVQLQKDRSWLRPALPQQLLLFQQPGENQVPIMGDEVSRDEWIEWASPIWRTVRETRTLNAAEGRGEEEEKHCCPLSLDIIERVIRLWSNPGETVLSPFAGLGSEGYGALLHGRRFVGAELKRNYWETACKNLAEAERLASQPNLFTDVVGAWG